MTEKKETVAVLGASVKAERYSNKAIKLLQSKGHRVIPIHPAIPEIEGETAVPRLSAVTEAVDTLTLYVGPDRSTQLLDEIVDLKPGRVILNPGTESDLLEARLEEAGIPFERACTLVLLRTGQF